jgi:hypothetical protein
MNRASIIIAVPALAGIVLLGVVMIDLHQFKSGDIAVRTMLGREVPLALIGIFGSAVSLVLSVRCAIKGQWRSVLLSTAGILLFLICFVIAGLSGGAFIYAT